MRKNHLLKIVIYNETDQEYNILALNFLQKLFINTYFYKKHTIRASSLNVKFLLQVLNYLIAKLFFTVFYKVEKTPAHPVQPACFYFLAILLIQLLWPPTLFTVRLLNI